MRHPDAAQELLDRVGRLAEHARETGERRLITVTREIDPVDPTAVAFASRRADDRWFCWEEPDRDGLAIAGIGSAHEVVSRGDGRSADLIADTTAIMLRRLADEPENMPTGAGPLWSGGMAFSAHSASGWPWSSLPPALLVLPEL